MNAIPFTAFIIVITIILIKSRIANIRAYGSSTLVLNIIPGAAADIAFIILMNIIALNMVIFTSICIYRTLYPFATFT